MSDVTPKDIADLSDADLRTLIGLLCEAEVRAALQSSAAVTYGGDQDSADGGLDVRVAAPSDLGAGYIPRAHTGFQAKRSDLLPAKIISEMRPKGLLRASIAELASLQGAYIIVSSNSSVSDSALARRRAAMRGALVDLQNPHSLHVDFYDRTRLASWVREYPGVSAWVLERVGRTFSGWRAWGAWAGGAEPVSAEYILDDTLKVSLGAREKQEQLTAVDGLQKLRDGLRTPGSVFRLVGLSGVGKTRFAQALFDQRIGTRPLDPATAIYANMGEDPFPQPAGMLSDLIAKDVTAVVVIDNSTPQLHHVLMEMVRTPKVKVSLLTIEYDIKDDIPEATSVVRLDPSSDDLIEKLVNRRYPNISQVDVRTITAASNGNARVALAIASTAIRGGSISGLSDQELFERLFYQRHDRSSSLFVAAQALSLAYSFDGKTLDGPEAELPHLAKLADQSPTELVRHVSTLLERDLIQKRGPWRAVLPHAVANRLATIALRSFPHEMVAAEFLQHPRLLRSLSHRLSFLIDVPEAVAFAVEWLEPNQPLGNFANLNELGKAVLANIAPLIPRQTLAGLRQLPVDKRSIWADLAELIRHLAYDADLFHEAAQMLIAVATTSDERHAKDAGEMLTSLMPIHLSGTKASYEQRLTIIRDLIISEVGRTLGFSALSSYLQTGHFSSIYSYEFGGRSRDYGYYPETEDDVDRWFGAGFSLVAELASNEMLRPMLRDVIATNFRGLWHTGRHDATSTLMRSLAVGTFWAGGWSAILQTLSFDAPHMEAGALEALRQLEREMRPMNLRERVLALVTSGSPGTLLDVEEPFSAESYSRNRQAQASEASQLGRTVANDPDLLLVLVPDLLRGGRYAKEFGEGLGSAESTSAQVWRCLSDATVRYPETTMDLAVLAGFLAGLSHRAPELVETLLEDSLNHPLLKKWFPSSQLAVDVTPAGLVRLLRAAHDAEIPLWPFRSLAFGRRAESVTHESLRHLLAILMERDGGAELVLEILGARMYDSAKKGRDESLALAGRDLLMAWDFGGGTDMEDHHLATVAAYCLAGGAGLPVAVVILDRMAEKVSAYKTWYRRHDALLKALLQAHPVAFLDILASRKLDPHDWFNDFDDHQQNPLNALPTHVLLEWCHQAPGSHYEAAASLVSFEARGEGEDAKFRQWSPHALALLSEAPDKGRVLAAFVNRFSPSGWSGSLATILETRAGLLDPFLASPDEGLAKLARSARERILEEAASAREREGKRDRARDERFE